MKFNYSLKEVGGVTSELVLNGAIDARVEFPEESYFINTQNLYVDFENVSLIDSMGIKRWVNFCEKINQSKSLRIYFRKCPQLIVNQINRIVGFLPPNGSVISFYIPVFCSGCDQTFQVFQDVSKIKDQYNHVLDRVTRPSCTSYPHCRNTWELDIVANEYLHFLKESNG